MDEDEINFKEFRDNLKIADDMRELNRTRNYTDKALDKSIFNNLENDSGLYFFMTHHGGKKGGLLTNLELSNGMLGIDYSISEKKYNRLMLPIYRIQADVEVIGFETVEYGFINGVIRPTITNNFERINMNKPELHFYFENPQGNLFYGRSTTIDKKNISTDLREWDKTDYRIVNDIFLNDPKKLLPAWFEVLLSPNEEIKGNFFLK